MDTSRQAGEESTTAAVHRVEFDVDWPPGFVSAYVLDGDEPVLVDAGHTENEGAEAFRDGLDDIGLEPADIDHVIVTHPHIDHLGMVETVREAGDATVYAPATWRDRPDEPQETARCVRESGVPESMVDSVVEQVVDNHERVHGMLDHDWVDEWVSDGQAFTIDGQSFTAHATPGHQRDHLCFAVELENSVESGTETVDSAETDSEATEASDGVGTALFSGDMAISTFRAPVLHAVFKPGQREGLQAYLDSLDHLETLDVDRVYPGHGPVHDTLPEAIEVARRGLERLCDRTVEKLDGSGTSAVEIASERTDDVREGPWVPETVAALAHLEREGRAESRLEDGVRLYFPVE